MARSERATLVVVTELFRRSGGVQKCSRNIVESMDRIFGCKVPVVSLNDRLEDVPAEFLSGRQVFCCGTIPRLKVLCFALSVLRFGRGLRVFSTHPNLARLLKLLKPWLSIKYVVVTHGIDAWNVSSSGLRGALLEANELLPVSHFTKSRLIEQLGPEAPSMSVLPNLIDGSEFFPANPATDWRGRMDIASDSFVILTVTRLERTEAGKGYDLVMEAVESLRESIPELVWVLAGSGDDLPRLKKHCVIRGIEANCRFPGFIDQAELADLYRSADVFVLPSRKEGFGIVFLEAAACGLAVIGGNADGSVDALGGGKFGVLIDPYSLEEIEAAIAREYGIWKSIEGLDRDPVGLHKSVVREFGKAAFDRRLSSVLELIRWD